MNKIITSIALALVLVGFSGCKTAPNNGQMTHAVFTAAVTLGEQIALSTHPEATPYVRAGASVVCSVANSTNVSPASIVAALEAAGVTNRTAVLIINGSIALLNVATSNLGTNQTEIRLYSQDLCNAMVAGLPPTASGAMARAHRQTLPPHLP